MRPELRCGLGYIHFKTEGALDSSGDANEKKREKRALGPTLRHLQARTGDTKASEEGQPGSRGKTRHRCTVEARGREEASRLARCRRRPPGQGLWLSESQLNGEKSNTEERVGSECMEKCIPTTVCRSWMGDRSGRGGGEPRSGKAVCGIAGGIPAPTSVLGPWTPPGLPTLPTLPLCAWLTSICPETHVGDWGWGIVQLGGKRPGPD